MPIHTCIRRVLLAAVFLFAPGRAHAEPVLSELMTSREFTQIANELAPKVNLFRDAWAKDPEAKFFGGTSRDYLYWLKGELRKAGSKEELAATVARLKALPFIDVREFIVGESDVDILSQKNGIGLDHRDYGVKKIDFIDGTRLDPKSESGKTEREQGFIPVEKIVIARQGIVPPVDFGDGAHEIFTGKLTVNFATRAVFDKTHYAQIGMNHPSLLALRYLRGLAMNYYYEHGKGVPDTDKLFDIDPKSADALQRTIAESLSDPKLAELLKSDKFAHKLNETVHKGFRSYTNPSAALALFKHFGADNLVAAHSQIEPINQYLFAQYRDESAIANRFSEYGVSLDSVLTDGKKLFPDGKLYHGTKREEAFRGILLQGVLQSEGGSGGKGLYGVAKPQIAFAENWGGAKDRVIAFPVKPTAKIVDITQGPGQALYEEFRKRNRGANEDSFAEYFGFDIVKYPYNTEAFVVKNSDALGRPRGHTREILTLGELLVRAGQTVDRAGFDSLYDSMKLNALTNDEGTLLMAQTPYLKELAKSIKDPATMLTFLERVHNEAIPAHAVWQVLGHCDYAPMRERFESIRNNVPKIGKVSPAGANALLTLLTVLEEMRQKSDVSPEKKANYEAIARDALIALRDEVPKELKADPSADGDIAKLPLTQALLHSWTGPDAEKDIRWLQEEMGRMEKVTAETRRSLGWKMTGTRMTNFLREMLSLTVPVSVGAGLGYANDGIWSHFGLSPWSQTITGGLFGGFLSLALTGLQSKHSSRGISKWVLLPIAMGLGLGYGYDHVMAAQGLSEWSGTIFGGGTGGLFGWLMTKLANATSGRANGPKARLEKVKTGMRYNEETLRLSRRMSDLIEKRRQAIDCKGTYGAL